MYKPEELIFYIEKPYEGVDVGYTVIFTTIECWENTNDVSYDLGSHNIANDLLLECGVIPFELVESIFELGEQYPPNQVRDKLITNGFKEDVNFSSFMDNLRSGGFNDWFEKFF